MKPKRCSWGFFFFGFSDDLIISSDKTLKSRFAALAFQIRKPAESVPAGTVRPVRASIQKLSPLEIRSARKTGRWPFSSRTGRHPKAFPTGEGGPRSGPDEVHPGACKAPVHDHRTVYRHAPKRREESSKPCAKYSGLFRDQHELRPSRCVRRMGLGAGLPASAGGFPLPRQRRTAEKPAPARQKPQKNFNFLWRESGSCAIMICKSARSGRTEGVET